MKWNAWVVAFIAVWVGISPWVLGFNELNLPTWNCVLAGILIILFLIWDYTRG